MQEEEEEESVEERYKKMSKHEKLALLMIALGEDAASTLLKDLTRKIRKIYANELETLLLSTKN